MILAISNINMHTYFSIRDNISQKEVNSVRFSQVYEKSQNNTFTKIHFTTLAQKKFKQSNENVSMGKTLQETSKRHQHRITPDATF